jgi:signal transduction histidine kinase
VLSLEEKLDEAIISVRDFGPGVPDKSLARIFDPFFRVEEARNTNGGGSGLGLSIAKRAVHLHRGSIAAENATPGLRVTIVIPLTHQEAIKTA